MPRPASFALRALVYPLAQLRAATKSTGTLGRSPAVLKKTLRGTGHHADRQAGWLLPLACGSDDGGVGQVVPEVLDGLDEALRQFYLRAPAEHYASLGDVGLTLGGIV